MSWFGRLWTRIGRLTFWAAWPLLWIYLRRGERTRVLIVSEGQALVVKGWLGSGKWVLPGGGLHSNESPIDGALRELYEETGLRLLPEDLQEGGQDTSTDSGLAFKFHAFYAQLPKPSLLKHWSFEILEIAWVPLEQLTPATAENSTAKLATRWTSGQH